MRLLSVSRAEHIGSLKRPDFILQKRAEFEGGKCTADELKTCVDECIGKVVRMQLELGLPVITDGEYRRGIFYEGIFDRLGGLREIRDPPESMFTSYYFVKSWPITYVCIEKLNRVVPLYGDDFDFLKKVAGPENISKLKMTLGSPEWYHFRHREYTYEATAYANDDEYFADVARIYREEIRDLYSRGCRRIQIDDPVLGSFCDEGYRRRMQEAGVVPEKLLDVYMNLLNDCLRDKPADMTAGIHVCRGNVKPDATPFTRGPYDLIAQKLFTMSNVDCFYLEYDTDGAGSFAPLRYLPPGKVVVLGLISTKTPELEDPEALLGRIMQAADVIAHGEIPRPVEEALDQLCISPQCGFASHSRGFAFFTHEDMVKKLELVRDVAQRVWG